MKNQPAALKRAQEQTLALRQEIRNLKIKNSELNTTLDEVLEENQALKRINSELQRLQERLLTKFGAAPEDFPKALELLKEQEQAVASLNIMANDFNKFKPY